ncbi:uncharacterized protein LOC132188792 [Corylus avellana]|uniref:uncharacterized protein LOC132188792 n=1 Tax=Corylus avellana TaxID=13451 RepID=UPI001E1F4852|nr:uncharacterized protein LOC132188792 [Corylus avellana]
MGNGLALQQKIIKIMKADGKVVAYKAPMKAQQVLSEFPGHAISATLPVVRHLKPETKLLYNHVYYLVPLPPPSAKVVKKKKVRFASPEREDVVEEKGVVRIKVVITKKELAAMLQKGVVSVDEMVAQLQSKSGIDGAADDFTGGDNCRQWKPDLESIAEVN